MVLMYSYKWKIAGVVISAIALIAMVIERVSGFLILKDLNMVQHYAVFEWIMLSGLVMIMYSREKYEDEQAKLARLKSFQIAFVILIGLLLNLGVLGIVFPSKVPPIHPETLLMISAIAIFLYLIVFYAALYFYFLWQPNDINIWEHIKTIQKNKILLVIYIFLMLITNALIFI